MSPRAIDVLAAFAPPEVAKATRSTHATGTHRFDIGMTVDQQASSRTPKRRVEASSSPTLA